MPAQNTTIRSVAVIGAGPSGLVAVKSLLAQGLNPIAFEKSVAIGGLWRYDEAKPDGGGLAYRSLMANTSKWMGVFSDLPFDAGIPEFPSREQMLQYLNRYADHFKLRPHICLNTEVLQVIRTEHGRWEVRFRTEGAGEEFRTFDAVVVASGFYTVPYMPELPGQETFNGEILHSAAYKGPEGFEGKRVVVIGCGSSGADLAAELGPVAEQVDVSTRSGVWFVPKMVNGRAYDTYRTRFSSKMPDAVSKSYFQRMLLDCYFSLGFSEKTIEQLNLPEFDLDRGKFIPATDILHQVRAGSVCMRTEIAEVRDSEVRYTDGTISQADVLLFCTGYGLRFSFLDDEVIRVQDRYTISLYRQVFHQEYDNLAFLAMNFAGGAAFPMMEIQARWIARVFSGGMMLSTPAERSKWIEAYFAAHQEAGTDPMSLKLLDYLGEMSGLLGIRPVIWKHPRLLGKLIFGAHVPAQYRLDGPGRSDTAAEIIADQGYLTG